METDELIYDCGLSEPAALLIKLVSYLASRRRLEGLRLGRSYTDKELIDFFVAAFIGEGRESVFAIAFSAEGRVCHFGTVGSGTVNKTSMFTRRIAELAVRSGASRLIIAHNHPRGVAESSPDDESATEGLFLLLRALGVRLLSHLVVAERDVCIIKPNAETGATSVASLVSSDAELSAGTIFE